MTQKTQTAGDDSPKAMDLDPTRPGTRRLALVVDSHPDSALPLVQELNKRGFEVQWAPAVLEQGLDHRQCLARIIDPSDTAAVKKYRNTLALTGTPITQIKWSKVTLFIAESITLEGASGSDIVGWASRSGVPCVQYDDYISETDEDMKGAGAIAHLPKPQEPEELPAALDSLLKKLELSAGDTTSES